MFFKYGFRVLGLLVLDLGIGVHAFNRSCWGEVIRAHRTGFYEGLVFKDRV